jgi:hypothetical protein
MLYRFPISGALVGGNCHRGKCVSYNIPSQCDVGLQEVHSPTRWSSYGRCGECWTCDVSSDGRSWGALRGLGGTPAAAIAPLATLIQERSTAPYNEVRSGIIASVPQAQRCTGDVRAFGFARPGSMHHAPHAERLGGRAVGFGFPFEILAERTLRRLYEECVPTIQGCADTSAV